jgi:hypothetical protein
MADQKASKYYAAEEEAQMKKVCAFLAIDFYWGKYAQKRMLELSRISS